ncbi:hypothetical protein [Paenibacillus gansuensis]|uniref:Competence protein CoiA-like family protein n=1 Tax=Paenibacillus gansuensis TaxID=306542 RepID=A0ABW5PH03_9BACL
MEIALLRNEPINIEAERRHLEDEGYSWTEVKSQLESTYREYSKKEIFRCSCCNSPTFLVLNEDRSSYFRHKNNTECAGTRNYKRYVEHTNRFENAKHKTGKIVMIDQLKANLTPHGASVIAGYMLKQDLKFVPDCIIIWPDNEIYSFDYITGTKSKAYQTYLINKMQAYNEHGIKSYFLFDNDLRTIHGNTLAVSHAEKASLTLHERDKEWEEILTDLVTRYGHDAVLQNMNLELADLNVNRIMYVSENFDGTLYKICLIKSAPYYNREIPDQWYFILGKPKGIAFQSMFSFEREVRKFHWELPNIEPEELTSFTAKMELWINEQSQPEEQEAFTVDQTAHSEKLQENTWIKHLNHFKQTTETTKITTSPDTSERIEYYKLVMNRMKESPYYSPEFQKRMTECEEDIQRWELNGIVEDRLVGAIRMMEIPLKLNMKV